MIVGDWLVAYALALAGFAALSMSMTRHQRVALGALLSPARRRALRAAGFVLLAASGSWCVLRFGVGLGLVAWATLIAFAALAVILVLTFRPRWMRFVAWRTAERSEKQQSQKARWKQTEEAQDRRDRPAASAQARGRAAQPDSR